MNGDERTLALKYTKNVLVHYYIFPRKLSESRLRLIQIFKFDVITGF